MDYFDSIHSIFMKICENSSGDSYAFPGNQRFECALSFFLSRNGGDVNLHLRAKFVNMCSYYIDKITQPAVLPEATLKIFSHNRTSFRRGLYYYNLLRTSPLRLTSM